MQWQSIKKSIGSDVTKYLVANTDLVRIRTKLEWFQLVNDVAHVILMEKMKGSYLRVRVFAVAPNSGCIGGNMTRTTIEGGGVAGKDYFWPISTQHDVGSAVFEICEIFQEFVFPWFSVMTSCERIRAARVDYPVAHSYSLDIYDYIETGGAAPRQVRESEFFRRRDFESFVHEHIFSSLRDLSFSSFIEGRIYLRKRDAVTDVIEIQPFNYGTKYCCYAYNWISELAADSSGGFSEESRVILNGGLLRELKHGNSRLSAYDATGSKAAADSLDKLLHRLRATADIELLAIRDRADFVSAAKANYPDIAGAYGF